MFQNRLAAAAFRDVDGSRPDVHEASSSEMVIGKTCAPLSNERVAMAIDLPARTAVLFLRTERFLCAFSFYHCLVTFQRLIGAHLRMLNADEMRSPKGKSAEKHETKPNKKQQQTNAVLIKQLIVE